MPGPTRVVEVGLTQLEVAGRPRTAMLQQRGEPERLARFVAERDLTMAAIRTATDVHELRNVLAIMHARVYPADIGGER